MTTERLSGDGRMHRLGLLAVVSVVTGLVVAALAFPVVGGLGLAARAGANSFDNLPAALQTPALPQRSTLYAADGQVLATLYLNEDRVVVPLSRIPDITRKALIAIEDSRFYEHHGVDFQGILRAAFKNASSGSVSQGGSTLTQQYVKNVLVESATTPAAKKAATADTLARKVREARYAIELEKKLTKDQILERYFNIAYFGSGAYGIGTAAQHYFSTPVDKLDLSQSALLAGLVQNPSAYDPVSHPEAAQQRRDTVLGRMRDLGYLTPAEAAAAMAQPLGLHLAPEHNGCVGSMAPYYCQWLLAEAQGDPAFGKSADARKAKIFEGGLKIYTTLDPKVQRAAQDAVNTVVPPADPSGVNAAMAMVQPGTGRVLAMAQDTAMGTGRGQTFNNYATGGVSGFQAGSTFKVFTLTTAVQQGLPLSTTIDAQNCYVSPILNNPKPDPGSTCRGYSNAGDSEAGTYDIPEATWRSVNTFYVPLEERVGVLNVAATAKAMGLRMKGDPTVSSKDGSFTLGTRETDPLNMADTYATLAAQGTYCAPMGITKVVDSTGKVIAQPKPQCQRALDPDVANTVTSVLTGVIDGPDPLRTGANASIGRPAAGKTGTTDKERAAWFDGYVPQLAAAVWMGNAAGPAAHPLQKITINGQYYQQVYGGDLPALMWHKAMSAALDGVPAQGFTTPAPPGPPRPSLPPAPTP